MKEKKRKEIKKRDAFSPQHCTAFLIVLNNLPTYPFSFSALSPSSLYFSLLSLQARNPPLGHNNTIHSPLRNDDAFLADPKTRTKNHSSHTIRSHPGSFGAHLAGSHSSDWKVLHNTGGGLLSLVDFDSIPCFPPWYRTQSTCPKQVIDLPPIHTKRYDSLPSPALVDAL